MTRKVLDENYFHISNSGITTRTVEQTYGKGSDNKKWRLENDLHAFGIGFECNLPLETVEQIDTYIQMLTGVRQRMLDHFGPEGKHPYGSLNPSRPLVLRGLKVVQDWSEDGSKNGSDISRTLIGYKLVDKNGVQQEYIEVPETERVRLNTCSQAKL